MSDKLLTKRYWLFGGLIYYASGGMEDFIASFDTKEEALAKAIELEYIKAEFKWHHVIDTQDETIEGEGKACNPMGAFL